MKTTLTEMVCTERRMILARGTRQVIASRNDTNSSWSARVYVNNGETATLLCCKRATADGVRKWADKNID